MNSAKWKDVKKGLLTLLSRNAIIAVLFNITYSYSTAMKSAYRPLVVKVGCGMPVAYITVLSSIFSFVAFMLNVPVGSIIDKKRGMMKRVLIAANVLRAVSYFFGYGMVHTVAGAYIVYIFDGIAFCFCNIMGPALMAISVDKKAMGSAFALYSGVTSICIATAKSVGISLFNNHGQLVAGGVSAIIALMSALVLMLLDGNKLSDTLRKEEAELKAFKAENQVDESIEQPKAVKKGRRFSSLIAGFSVEALPLALCIGLSQIEDSVGNSYLAILAIERNFTYLTTLSVLSSISGVITIFIGSICDIINPMIMVYIALAGKVIGNLIISGTGMENVFIVGLCAITLSDFFITVCRISAVKLFPYREQGSLAATISMMMSVCMMLGTLPAGYFAQKQGVGAAYIYSAFTSGLGVIAYTYAMRVMHKRKKTMHIDS